MTRSRIAVFVCMASAGLAGASPCGAQSFDTRLSISGSRLRLPALQAPGRALGPGAVSWLADLRLAPADADAGDVGSRNGLRVSSGWLWAAGTAAAGLATLTGPEIPRSAPWLLRGSLSARPTPADDGETPSPAMFVGLGYAHATQLDGWGFRADVGWAASDARLAGPGNPLLLGQHTTDRALRQLRWRPVFQMGMHLPF